MSEHPSPRWLPGSCNRNHPLDRESEGCQMVGAQR